MRINISNINKVREALDKVQKNSRTRILTLEDISSEAKKVEGEMERAGIPKALRVGARVIIAPHRVPHSYRYPAQATVAVLERGTRDWFLVSVRRAPCGSVAYSRTQPAHVLLKAKDPKGLLKALLQKHGMELA